MNSFNERQKNVLIIYDNESFKNIIKYFLKNVPNITFFEAENGLQAIDIYKITK